MNTRFKRLLEWLQKPSINRGAIGLILVVCVLLLLYVTHGSNNVASYQADLIKNYDWSDFAGAEVTPRGVVISPLDRKIVNQDGSGGQPNPPVNLSGPALKFNGATTFELNVEGFRDGDSFRIYNGAPIVYDEWRLEPQSIELLAGKKSVNANVWDGQSSQPAKTSEFEVGGNIDRLAIKFDGKTAYVIVNGQTIGSINLPSDYKDANVWFGASATNAWTIKTFNVSSDQKLDIAHGLSTAYKQNPAGLQALTRQNRPDLSIGTAVSLNQLLVDQNYRRLAFEQFGSWTTENALKAQFIHPEPDVYDFKEADLLINTARNSGIKVHGHTLVFGEANPRWMQVAPDKRSVMTDHITNVAGHYSGKISDWDVVNEPLSDEASDYQSDGLRRNIWYEAMGQNYIALALKTTKAADPKAKLYINDYGLEADGDRWDAMINLIKSLKNQGIPLDGIGFESHVYDDGDEIDPTVLAKHIEQLKSLGLSSRISEIDVHGDDSKLQAQQYSEVLGVCLREPSCMAYTTWGITDKYGSTTEHSSYPPEYGDDLIWDHNYQPKLAYKYLVNILKSK